jgi:hypothetical protein
MTETFPCPACGAPNEPEPGATRMTCAYCLTNLTIPVELQKPPVFKVGIPPAKIAPTGNFQEEASDLLRKAQPVATKAWNAFAYWSWIRRVLPGCLVIIVIGICLCAILGVWPFFSQMFR